MEPENLVDLFEASARRFEARPALGTKRDGQWQWATYGELARLVDRCRGGLAALGVGPGDRVAIISENRLEWAVAAFATYGLGAIYVPMYASQLRSEWKHILDDSGAKAVLAGGDRITTIARELAAESTFIQHLIELDLPREDPRGFGQLLALGGEHPCPARHPDPDAVVTFIYTSGTTGLPKGVVLTHGNIVSNLVALQEVFPISPDDRSLAFLPWAHSYGQVCELYNGINQGSSSAINDAIPNLLQNLAEVRPTTLVAVPRIFNRLYDSVVEQVADRPAPVRKMFEQGLKTAAKHRGGERDTWLHELELRLDDRLIFSKVRDRLGGRLRLVTSGAAALSREVAELVDAAGLPVYEGYGLTETSPIVTTNTPEHRRLGSVGRPLPGVRVDIDRTVTFGAKEGEIVVHGPNVMKGYHNLPEETARTLTDDGGLRTGDLGYLDDDGFLYITGRIKEQYKLENGKFVMPGRLEEQLKLSPYVANVMVHGENRPFNVAIVVPDRDALARWAERRGITGELAKSPAVRGLLEAEVRERAQGVRGYEVPQRILVVEEDFTTENGMLTPTLKLKRRAVLARYRAELDALYASGERAQPTA